MGIDTSSDSDTYTDTEDDWRREDSRLRMDKNPKKAPKNIKNNERLEDALKLKINGSLACNSCLPVIRKFKSQEALDQHCKAKHGLVKQLGKKKRTKSHPPWKTILISQSTERPKSGLYCDSVLSLRNRKMKSALKLK